MMGLFNNREIATAIWLLVFAIWAFRKSGIRKSIWVLLRTFCYHKILLSVVLMLFYVLGLVTAMRALGMWNIGLLKDTVIWFFAGALSMMMRFATVDDTAGLFSRIVKDNLKIVIILVFLVNTYTFSLGFELVLVPVLAFIAMIDAVASAKDEYVVVAKITNGLQIVIGIVILGFAFLKAIDDWQTLSSFYTFQRIALTPLLSMGLFPFVYIMLIVSEYEQIFMRLNFGAKKTGPLKKYIRLRVISYAKLSMFKLGILKRNLVDLMHVQNIEDIDSILNNLEN